MASSKLGLALTIDRRLAVDGDGMCTSADVAGAYTLAAVVLHQGPSLTCGHYAAVIDVSSGQGDPSWVLFNDEHVSVFPQADLDLLLSPPPESSGKVQKRTSARGRGALGLPYLIFYRKGDRVVGKEGKAEERTEGAAAAVAASPPLSESVRSAWAVGGIKPAKDA